MALIVSAATGNFNATATWVGGVVPTIGDEAQASTGHTVTITATTACDLVSNAGTGKFVLNSGVILTANVQHKGATNSTNCVEYFGTGANAKIIGNITGGSAFGRIAVNNTGAGTLEIQGNCVGGSDASAVVNSVGGSVIITGNLTGGNTGIAYALNNNQNGSVTISGNATGSAISAINNTSTGSITLNGNVLGGTAANSAGVRNASTATTVTITGTCTGGTNATASGIINVSTGSVTLNGSSIGGTGTSAGPGVQNSSTGNVFVTRAVGNGFGPGSTGISAAVGVANAGLGIVEIQALEYGTFGQSPTSGTGIRLKKANTNVAVFNYCDTAGAKTLIDATANAAMPAASDVRSGVSYASGALTGSCAVPAASSVSFGVPVGNTTGTAVLTPADVQSALTAQGLTTARAGNLDNLDATVSSRLAPNGTLATVTTLTNAPDVPTEAEIASAVWSAASREITGGTVDTLTNAPASVTPSDIWSHATRTITGGTVDTLTNAPTVPSAASIRAEIDSNSTQLAAIKAKTDALPASPAATGDIPSANISAIKAKTDLLQTDRLAQCSTVATTGAQLAAALS